jgi:hypothetical protein
MFINKTTLRSTVLVTEGTRDYSMLSSLVHYLGGQGAAQSEYAVNPKADCFHEASGENMSTTYLGYKPYSSQVDGFNQEICMYLNVEKSERIRLTLELRRSRSSLRRHP